MNAREERELFAANLDRHVEEEGKVLGEYRTLAEKISDGFLGLLIDLILTEEEQHHFLLRAMARNLREPLREEPQFRTEDVSREELLQRTRRLRDHERKTIEACRTLHSQTPVEEPEFFHAMLDVVMLDSEKHQRLLLAVERMLLD